MAQPPAWHEAYPAPRNQSPKTVIPRQELLQWLQDGQKKPGVDFLLVDLRRTDHEVRYYLFIYFIEETNTSRNGPSMLTEKNSRLLTGGLGLDLGLGLGLLGAVMCFGFV
jgi:hypothetical protein